MSSSTKNRYKLMTNPNSHSRTTCAAYGCDMRSGTNALSEIKMYQFPRDPYRRRRWELATRRANWKANNKSRLCCKHFLTGKPSKDPKHPDYIPSIFVFSKNVQSLKKSFNKMQKKLNSSEAENLTNLDSTTSHEETCIASSCGKGFCATCFSPESVSSAFNMSLAPLNQTLTQLMDKLKDMEVEREQLRNELANCREEIHQLREAHQHCEVQSQSTSIYSKPNNFVSVPSPTSEDVTEILESMYSGEPSDIDDPESYPSVYLEQDFLQSSDKSSPSKRQRKHTKATNYNDVIGIEQCPSPKKKKVKGSNLKSKGTTESPKSGKSSDAGSPLTIVYLKR